MEYVDSLSRSQNETFPALPELDAEIDREKELLNRMQKNVDEEEKKLLDKKRNFISYLKSLS